MQYRGLTLDRFQRQAIEVIQEGRSVIVSAPTGTGKTLIADYLIDLMLDEGSEVIYTSPIKALSNQKYRQYVKLFGEDNIGLITGDLVINRDAPIKIMTTEILRNILLEGDHSPLPEDVLLSPSDVQLPELSNLGAVIIDEIHFLDDPDRGTVWEELLIYLPEDIQILGLSATLSNLEEFANWLSTTRDQDVEIVYEPRRAVPLQFFLFNRDVSLLPVHKFDKRYNLWRKENPRGKRKRSRGRGGDRRDRNRRDQTRHIHVIEALHKGAFPALYFIFSRALVERLAFDLATTRTGKRLVNDATRKRIEARLQTFHEDNPEVLTGKLERMYRQGIAFHHAGLHVSLKGLVEELYEAGLVRVLYCTSTFALGINMPARTVIFDALTKYNGTAIVPLTVREFMQMAGRAGRRGIDTEGDIIIRQDFQDYDDVKPLITQLLEGESEPVNSSFNLSFHAVVNLLDRFPQETIERLLEQSFKAYRSNENARDLRDQISERESLLDQQPREDADDKKRSSRLRRHRKKLASLRRRLVEEERPHLWEEFERKITFLRNYGYLGPQNELLAPALILKKIKMEEIFLTEMILNGVLEDLTPPELFGVMCGLVQTLPRSARISHAPAKWRDILEPIFEIYDSELIAQSAKLSQHNPVFTPELMPLGERWARGDSLADLLAEIDNPTDLSGDLVGAMRRAKDMIGQLRHVYFEDETMRQDLTQLMRDVSRDEVQVLG